MDLLDKIIADSEQVSEDIQVLVRDLRKTLENYTEEIGKLL